MPPMADHPRESLYRMADTASARLEYRADTTGDGLGTFVGYLARFNEWTEIQGWEGHFIERFLPTAFDKTLDERRDHIKILFNHGFDPSIGDKPLGRPAVLEARNEGLWTEVPLADTSYNRDLAELLRVGAIDGSSIRFSVPAKRDDWNDRPERSSHNPDGLPERSVREAILYEGGPVTFPAYQATTAGVRSSAAYEAWIAAQQRGPKITYADLSTTAESITVTGGSVYPTTSAPSLGAPALSRAVAQQMLRQFRLKAGIPHAPARTEPPG